MKQNSLTLPIVGGAIAFLCFFLPWLKFDMSSMGIREVLPQAKVAINISGFDVALGSTNFVTLAFLAAIAIIGICIYIYMLNQKTPWKARTIVLISSGIGVLCLLFTLIRVIQGFSLASRMVEPLWQSAGSDVELDKIISPQFGGFGAVIGFIVAFIGAWNIPKSNTSMEE